MIPQEKSAAVFRGLQEAFGTTDVDISQITEGLSSDLIFRIVVKGSCFLLRIMTRIDERNDPRRIFTAMNAAAEAGLAPRVLYFNIDEGIAIIDFVETQPLPVTKALIQVPRTLRKLHALPPFPKGFNYVTAHKGFIWRFRTANLLRTAEVEEVFARYEQICAVYPRLDIDMVSCHDDLKPENILFDGQRIWLAGWQAAFLNDRYFDLAIVANFVVNSDADEITYLHEYFGQAPDEYQQARFFLMSQVMHMFAATVYLLLGAGTLNNPLPSFKDFHQRIWASEINLADNEMKSIYGRIHWAQLLQNVRTPRFDESLRIVSDRYAPDKLLPIL